MDLFLLYLLLKFTRPQPKLEDGRTVPSAVLFAHDHSTARQVVTEQIDWLSQERSRDLLLRKHIEFINFVTKQWTEELLSSVGIGYEFLDRDTIQESDYSDYSYIGANDDSEDITRQNSFDGGIQGSILIS